ncbi:DNA polymerase-3 subunit alpha [Bacilli bacterium PM5-9]|nr:DNA polymerase-3 subunit alpha [Bacilli bacterium PM5-9]
MKITNLNVKSHYSLLSSTLKIDDIIQNALNNKYEYVALVDYSYFCGALEFIIKAKENNLFPIIGLEFDVSIDDSKQRIIGYAKNTKGFKNLEKISSLILLSDNKCLDYQEFIKYTDDLIIIVDLEHTTLYKNYLLNTEISLSDIDYLKNNFKIKYFYFNQNDTTFINNIKNYSDLIEIIASKISYEKQEDASLQYLLECIDKQEEADSLKIKALGDQHLLSYDEILNKYNEEIILNTKDFIKQFEVIDLDFNYTLPLYKNDVDEYIKKLSFKGLIKRLNTNDIPQSYLDRLKYELDVIVKMGYSNYFLVVYDYVLFARKNNILVGPGRGSSAGSLVAYCLGITNVDPIENKLLFERFLNPERISLPDIDVDFQDDKREDLISYLKDKYGYDNIAHIITFGTFQAKNSIRDLGRVLKIPNVRLDMILRLIPNVLNVRLSELILNSKELQVVLQANDDLNYVYKHAIKLEGINRHISTHAAGIIISDKSIVEYAPVLKGLNDTLMIQYNMDYLEKIGLYKMDILGLKNLSILSDILNDLEKPLNLLDIPLNDQKTLNLMSSGNTLGIFQFESAGVIKVLKKMKIDTINDMVATTALFRPGPMQYINEYIARKNNEKSFDYLHPDLEDILKETYGIIVYQEQIMQICQKMAGFSLAKADIVRKGMAKKDEKLLQEIKDDFITNSIKNGYTKEIANKVYDMILLFSNYGFNKAHAYSYALLGYYLAYLKANYPKVFFKNILSANVYNVSKLKAYLYEMKQYKLNIKEPNINKSNIEFYVEDNDFVLPLIAIKGLGENNANAIIEERNSNGSFDNFMDTIIRLNKIKINKNIIENLIYAGAMDCFEYNRKTMIENLDKIERYIDINKVNDDQIMLDLVGVPKPTIVKYVEDSHALNKELELLGLYLSNHPLDKYINKYPNAILENITDENSALVIVDTIKEIRTKKGELMAFIGVSDLIESKTLVVFPRTYQKYKSKVQVKDIILIRGKVDEKDNSNIILKALQILD